MKRASNSYRLQLIKEVATRQERLSCGDPMANYIQQLLDSKSESEPHAEKNYRFSGNHFDDHVGGWVSDKWGLK
ncbi:hypothetical protein HRJ45_04985 [Vibrio coralliilyticus]|uniref:hypothetical protein n=1 Tax=Vibrio coralliilyticus TaxID=190893 RepID=UPI0006CCF02B|nr:hypothetical protein [Vibrio coralliilyticus]AXN30890.1 hypothetical protein DVV14_06000 [Vibrio coralliilyticus]KPH27271.1 hypothetical protein ADU60_03150 [Vibrio coralliilyticus]NOI58488.1 hypothetical protein [Vibrio coralliilyticus]NRF25033.1 hypothetical protein [Vibrio coralliilyticus]NRF78445.1 hypothetical protein [Vibrio coralliilyticus]